MQKKQRGQVLVENLIVHLILLACAFGVIEIARLLAFKNCLQVVVTDTAQKISFSQLDLLRSGIITSRAGSFSLADEKYKKQLAKEIGSSLDIIPIFLFSFDERKENPQKTVLSVQHYTPALYLRYVNADSKKIGREPAGVYLKVNTCLPVLFSGFFRVFLRHQNDIPEIGVSIANEKGNESTRTCLGQYTSGNSLAPLFWFRVRAAAYIPWPATSQIYINGFAQPPVLHGLESQNRTDVQTFLQKADLTHFFPFSAKGNNTNKFIK